jgi:hypothetical protein
MPKSWNDRGALSLALRSAPERGLRSYSKSKTVQGDLGDWTAFLLRFMKYSVDLYSGFFFSSSGLGGCFFSGGVFRSV